MVKYFVTVRYFTAFQMRRPERGLDPLRPVFSFEKMSVVELGVGGVC
jgi:hypothetical protein